MSTTLREQILAEIKTRLDTGSSGITGLNVDRDRQPMLEGTELPHINITPKSEEAAPVNGQRSAITVHHFEVMFEVRVLATAAFSSIIEPVLSWIAKALQPETAGRVDFALGGLVDHIAPGKTEWKADDGSGAFAMAQRTYTFTYQTKTSNEEASS